MKRPRDCTRFDGEDRAPHTPENNYEFVSRRAFKRAFVINLLLAAHALGTISLVDVCFAFPKRTASIEGTAAEHRDNIPADGVHEYIVIPSVGSRVRVAKTVLVIVQRPSALLSGGLVARRK